LEAATFAVSAAVWGTVGGRQTVPRAEVVGAHHGLKLARAKEEVSIGIDASYVVSGAAKRAMARGSNADVWRPFFIEQDKFERPPLVIKVRAHCEKRGYHSEASPSITFANFAADLLAESAANDAAVSSDTVRRVAGVDAMAKAILTRLVTIDMDAAKAGRQEMMVDLKNCKDTDRKTIRTRAEASGHRLKAFGKGKVRCTKCQVAVARCGIPRWLAGQPEDSCPGWRLVRHGKICYAKEWRNLAECFGGGAKPNPHPQDGASNKVNCLDEDFEDFRDEPEEDFGDEWSGPHEEESEERGGQVPDEALEELAETNIKRKMANAWTLEKNKKAKERSPGTAMIVATECRSERLEHEDANCATITEIERTTGLTPWGSAASTLGVGSAVPTARARDWPS
jgi:ribonuclease HI